MSIKVDVKSTAFSQNGHIPRKYSCEGPEVNPPIEIGKVPEETVSLALIMEDPDAPRGIFYHWLLWNIQPNEVIAESSVPGVTGTNSCGNTGYKGPVLRQVPTGITLRSLRSIQKT